MWQFVCLVPACHQYLEAEWVPYGCPLIAVGMGLDTVTYTECFQYIGIGLDGFTQLILGLRERHDLLHIF